MGGGGDSRIPSILKDLLGPDFEVVIRTYSFNPETAREQIGSWVREKSPDLVIGESLGATHAIAVKGIPHLFVSPSLNAPVFFRVLAALALIPGVTSFFDWYYKPKEGDRQSLHFSRENLLEWKTVRQEALKNTPRNGSGDYFHAFFGTRTSSAGAESCSYVHGRSISEREAGPCTRVLTLWKRNTYAAFWSPPFFLC